MKVRNVAIVLIAVILFVLSLFYIFYIRKNVDKINSVSGQDADSQISLQAEWEAGMLNNIDSTTSLGSVKINETGSSFVDLQGIYNNDPSKFIADPSSNIPYMFDNDNLTVWEFDYSGTEVCANPENYNPYWQVDLGQNVYVVNIQANPRNIIDDVWHVSYSTNGIDFTEFGTFDTGWPDPGDIQTVILNQLARYIRVGVPGGGESFVTVENCPTPFQDFFGGIYEFDINTYAQATHTTAPTQIDGQEGSADKTLIEWTSFTPTQTTPANTSISYEFRTSDDGSNWTSWSAPQAYSGSPLDLTTLTPNRYLQVRATLSTTDALATPQIDDYTINFHNNQKPNKPTAQTAVIGN